MFYKETEYALRSLVYIQLQNLKQRTPGFAEIAEETDTPPYYMAKILQRMVRQGLIKSHKGKKGGFYFGSDKPDLQLKEVISTIEGNHLFTGCVLGFHQCSDNNQCPLHEKFVPIRDSINRLVNEESVQSLAKKIYKGEELLLNDSSDILPAIKFNTLDHLNQDGKGEKVANNNDM